MFDKEKNATASVQGGLAPFDSGNSGAGFTGRFPFLTACIIMFICFWLAHFTLSRAYQNGLVATLSAGTIYAFLTLFFLWTGFRSKAPFWKNISGLVAGLCWWCFFGEIGDTLQADFGVTTGIGIGYGNIPFLVVLGIVFSLVLYKKASADDTILQWINFAYLNWLGHVILLTVYYAPVLGGQTPELGNKIDCWAVWSKTRLIAAFIVWGIYLLVLLPLVLLKWRKSVDIRLKVASAFWFVVLFWSIFVEIPKKLVYFRLW